jgi:hypothetical protein
MSKAIELTKRRTDFFRMVLAPPAPKAYHLTPRSFDETSPTTVSHATSLPRKRPCREPFAQISYRESSTVFCRTRRASREPFAQISYRESTTAFCRPPSKMAGRASRGLSLDFFTGEAPLAGDFASTPTPTPVFFVKECGTI